jgi:hypothetical protein
MHDVNFTTLIANGNYQTRTLWMRESAGLSSKMTNVALKIPFHHPRGLTAPSISDLLGAGKAAFQ